MAQPEHRQGRTDTPKDPGRPARRRLLRLVGGGGAVAAGAALVSGLGAVAGAGQNTFGLEGAWEAAFLQYSSPPGAPPNRILHIFTGGGGVIAQFGPVGARAADGSFSRLSFGAGSWTHAGGREFEYSYRYVRWLGDLTQVEQIVVWVRLMLDAGGSQWAGDWKRRDVDGSGSVVRTLEGPVEGRRLDIDSLA